LQNPAPRSKVQNDAKAARIAEVYQEPARQEFDTTEAAIKTPLAEPFTQMFAGQLRNSRLFSGPSISDPLAAPTKLCFPGKFRPTMSRPAPIDTALMVSKYKK